MTESVPAKGKVGHTSLCMTRPKTTLYTQTHTHSSQRLCARLRCPVFKPICYCCLHRLITSISVTDGQRPLLACSFQAAKQMSGRHKMMYIIWNRLEKNSFDSNIGEIYSPDCTETSMGLPSGGMGLPSGGMFVKAYFTGRFCPLIFGLFPSVFFYKDIGYV